MVYIQVSIKIYSVLIEEFKTGFELYLHSFGYNNCIISFPLKEEII